MNQPTRIPPAGAERAYPLPRPAEDARFTFGLLYDVAHVLVEHGYPQMTGRDLVELQQALFTLIYTTPDPDPAPATRAGLRFTVVVEQDAFAIRDNATGQLLPERSTFAGVGIRGRFIYPNNAELAADLLNSLNDRDEHGRYGAAGHAAQLADQERERQAEAAQLAPDGEIDAAVQKAAADAAREPGITHHAVMRNGVGDVECGTRRFWELMTRAWKDVTCPGCLAALDGGDGGA
jgi:hypothetical protein